MNLREIRWRNYIGAFFGAVLGILSGALLHPIALPVGTLLGVVVGWHHRDIWQSIKTSVRKGFEWMQIRSDRMDNYVEAQATRLSSGVKSLFTIEPLRKLFMLLKMLFEWFTQRPQAIHAWLLAHPMNQAWVLEKLAILAYVTINLAILYFPFTFVSRNMDGANRGQRSFWFIPAFIMLLAFAFIAMGTIMSRVEKGPDEDNTVMKKMRTFYLAFEKFASVTKSEFFLTELKILLKMEFAACSMVVAQCAWFIGIGGAFLLLFIVPISAGIGLVKGVHEAVVKGGHWLCFAVTLLVSAFIAWLFYPYFGDARILWGTAIAAGLVSGLMTELARQTIVEFYEKNSRVKEWVRVDLATKLKPGIANFWGAHKLFGEVLRIVLPNSSHI